MHVPFTTKQKASLGLLIIGVASVVGVARILVDHKNNAVSSVASTVSTVSSQTNTAIAQVKGVSSEATQGTFYLTAGKVTFDTAGFVAIPVIVTNKTQSKVEFSPGLQIKLKRNGTAVLQDMEAPNNAVVMSGGPLAPEGSQSGSVYFKATAGDTLDLIFTPDLSVPNNQQNVRFE